MSDFKKQAFAQAARGVIKNLERGQMRGYYCEDSRDCIRKVLEILPDGCSIAWGGSETLTESGMMAALNAGSYTLIDRTKANTPEESRNIYAKTVMSDYYFMSTNAVTLAGELVNIDGNGNRLACLMQGPRQVIILAGMNKLVTDLETACQRIKLIAAPANAQRLNRSTPCCQTGTCENCFAPESVCSHTVITRRCSQKDRIHVFLIAEDLGY